jgi:hypothetical protein
MVFTGKDGHARVSIKGDQVGDHGSPTHFESPSGDDVLGKSGGGFFQDFGAKRAQDFPRPLHRLLDGGFFRLEREMKDPPCLSRERVDADFKRQFIECVILERIEDPRRRRNFLEYDAHRATLYAGFDFFSR